MLEDFNGGERKVCYLRQSEGKDTARHDQEASRRVDGAAEGRNMTATDEQALR